MMRLIHLIGRRLSSILLIWLCCWLAVMSGQAFAAPGLSLIAGNIAGPGADDAVGTAARFRTPSGIASDAAGNLYIADSKNHTIRKISPVGAVTTLAGTAERSGSADGSGAIARFNVPFDIAVGAASNLYVADSGNHSIRVISPTGAVTTLAGAAGFAGSADGNGPAARFNSPGGIAADANGNLYVTDTFNHVIRRITPAGAVTTIAGMAQMPGNADGNLAAARFNTPVGIALDRAGNLYVADTGNHTIRKITPAGVVTTLAGTAGSPGFVDGSGAAARFNLPFGVASDATGNLYVGDSGNYTIRKITPAG
jgi:streptogramin lyase